MLALRPAASRLAQAASTMVMTTRTTVIAGPPANKVSAAEKAVHAAVIISGCVATPAYILVHIKDYRGREA